MSQDDEPLLGHVDIADWRVVAGWAYNPDRPDEPIWLECVIDDRAPIRFLANMLRTDLRREGVGTGRYGFHLSLAEPLDPTTPHHIEIRRASDRRMLPNAPRLLERAPIAGAEVRARFEAAIAAQIEAAAQTADLLPMVDFLAGQIDRLLTAGAGRDNGTIARDRFRARWADTLEGVPSARLPVPDPRPWALLIDQELPEDGASLALIRALGRLGHRVAVVACAGLAATGDAAERLAAMGVMVHGRPLAFTVEDVLAREPGLFRCVLLRGVLAAASYGVAARRHSPRARIIACLEGAAEAAQNELLTVIAMLSADHLVVPGEAAAAELDRRVRGRARSIVDLAGPDERVAHALAEAVGVAAGALAEPEDAPVSAWRPLPRRDAAATLDVLLIHHAAFHFETALSFEAQLRMRHRVRLWSDSLDVRGRRDMLALRGVALFDPAIDYDALVLVTGDHPTDYLPPELQALLHSRPLLRIDHEGAGPAAPDRLSLFPRAPLPCVMASIGQDFSGERPRLAPGARRFVVQGNMTRTRDYQALGDLLDAHADARFDLVGTAVTDAAPSTEIVAARVQADPRVRLHLDVDEIAYYRTAARAHFILPLLDPERFPRYFLSGTTSSVLAGFSQSIPFIAHRRLFELYGLEGFAYDSDAGRIEAVRQAMAIEQGDYDAMVARLRATRERHVAAFTRHFDARLGGLGARVPRFRLGPFQRLCRQLDMRWDAASGVLSVPAGLVGRLAGPVLGWTDEAGLPQGRIDIPRDWLAALMRSTLSRVRVDAAWYRARYLADAPAGTDPHEHFLTHGYFADFLPCHVPVDEAYYFSLYPDVAESVRQGWNASAQAHFENHGLAEGRRPHAGWLPWDCYAAPGDPPAPDSGVRTPKAASGRPPRRAPRTKRSVSRGDGA